MNQNLPWQMDAPECHLCTSPHKLKPPDRKSGGFSTTGRLEYPYTASEAVALFAWAIGAFGDRRHAGCEQAEITRFWAVGTAVARRCEAP